jgi:hypothetical protein
VALFPKQKRKVTNRAAYDASLRQRGSLTVWQRHLILKILRQVMFKNDIHLFHPEVSRPVWQWYK